MQTRTSQTTFNEKATTSLIALTAALVLLTGCGDKKEKTAFITLNFKMSIKIYIHYENTS